MACRTARRQCLENGDFWIETRGFGFAINLRDRQSGHCTFKVSGDIDGRKHFDPAPAIAPLILDRNGIVKRAGIGITDAE